MLTVRYEYTIKDASGARKPLCVSECTKRAVLVNRKFERAGGPDQRSLFDCFVEIKTAPQGVKMKLSQFLAPDQVTLDAAHGDMYRCADENAGTYTTRRDRAEQAMVARAMTDPEFAALCSEMTDGEWSRFLDATCGVIPGKDRTKKNNSKYKISPEVKALFHRMKAEGYVTLWELSDICGQPITRLRNWIGHGFTRDGARTVMRSVREGRYVFTRVEWMEEFVAGAPPSIATGTPRKNAEGVEI